jgi:oligosaccharide repeat unit polymerase
MVNSDLVFVAAVVLTALFLAYSRLRYRKFDPFAPGFVLPLVLALCYLGPYFVFIRGIDGFTVFWDMKFDDQQAAVGAALAIYCLALVGVLVGLLLAGIQPSGYTAWGKSRIRDAKALTPRLYWLLVLGLASLLAMIGVALVGGPVALVAGLGDRINLFAGLNYFFVPTNMFISAALVTGAALLTRESSSAAAAERLGPKLLRGLPWLLCTAVAVFFGVILGSKVNIYIVVVSSLVVFHYIRRRFSVVELAVVGTVLFFLLMIYHLITRELLVVGEIVSMDEPSVVEFLDYAAVQLTGNLMQLQTMTVLLDRMPDDLPFQLGKTFLSFFTLPVPSSVWPDKFLTAPGVFTLAFWPERWLEQGTTLPPGILGEFYMNFGIAGVFAGAVSLGWLFERAFLAFAGEKSARAEYLIYYAILVAMLLHYIRGEFTAPTLLLLSIILPVWMIRLLAGATK